MRAMKKAQNIPPMLYSQRTKALGLDLVAVLLCGLAFLVGVRATGDLDWPHDVDLYRDIAQAQTILDGDYGADPLYLGETLWYNPLVPAVVATLAKLVNLPVHLVYTRAGAYLNLLAPLSFYALVVCLFDRWTALAGLLGFLFVVSGETPSWAAATYSPWLFTVSFIQSFFYITLIVYNKALYVAKHRWYLAVGIWLGITFLGHTAPALILGGIIGCYTLATVIRSWNEELSSPSLYRTIVDFAIVISLALLVSLPLTFSIIGHYNLRILNQDPGSWVYDALALPRIWSFISENLTPTMAVVCVGLVDLLLRRSRRIERNLILLWLSISFGFLVYSYIWQALKRGDIFIPSIVPGFHFLFYLKALESVLFGCGLVIISRFTVRFLAYAVPSINRLIFTRNHYWLWGEKAVLSVLMVGVFLFSFPGYETREDFTTARLYGQRMGQKLDWLSAFAWIQAHTRPTDVFLTSDDLGMFVVGPAGRKIVAVRSFFSNPYIDWFPRAAERDLLLEYLQAGEQEGFAVLASKYRITYLLIPGDLSQRIDQAVWPSLQKEFTSGGITIYRVVDLKSPVNLANKVQFFGSTVGRDSKGQMILSLHFLCIGELQTDYTLWCHASSAQGFYYFDHLLSPPTSQWRKGQFIRDDIVFDVPPGNYRVVFGLWMWQDGSRLYRLDENGHEIEVAVEVK